MTPGAAAMQTAPSLTTLAPLLFRMAAVGLGPPEAAGEKETQTVAMGRPRGHVWLGILSPQLLHQEGAGWSVSLSIPSLMGWQRDTH